MKVEIDIGLATYREHIEEILLPDFKFH